MKAKNMFDLSYTRNPAISWTQDEDGIVELVITHTSVFDKIAQNVFHKPEKSYIKLDKIGSFVWLQLENNDMILQTAEKIKAEYDEEVEKLLPRLAQYFKIMEQNNLIVRK